MAAQELPPFIPTMPYDGDISQLRRYGPFLVAQEFQGWREEVRSWKDGAYLGAVLSLDAAASRPADQDELLSAAQGAIETLPA